jgi:hypothetical protein
MILKTHKLLKSVYISCIIVAIIGFIADVLYTAKNVIVIENSGLERWAIIITLAGIFGALRLLHPKLKDTEKSDIQTAIQRYKTKYFARLISLLSICTFNLISFTITGSKNFVFLAFITIFAMFLCTPNKKHLEEETNI